MIRFCYITKCDQQIIWIDIFDDKNSESCKYESQFSFSAKTCSVIIMQ